MSLGVGCARLRKSIDTSTLTEARPGTTTGQGQLALVWLHPHETPQVSLLTEELTVGRDPSCDVVIDSPLVSRRHARFRRNGPIVVAEDLDSRNGIFLDAVRTDRAPVVLGQLWRIGEALARVVECGDASDFSFSEVVPGQWGGSQLRAALGALGRVARSDLPVVVEGESGCGKEGVARAVHEQSGRSGRFVALDCASLPEHLAESQLFGHKRGAFTGAERTQSGYLVAASGGTLFLDEVVELPLGVQAKLLRALQQGEVVAIGATEPTPVDLRIVVAAQCPLNERVDDGRFRGDLYARLRGITLELPPLRERSEDVPPLFRRFLRQHLAGPVPRVNPRLVEQLCLHTWPLNVRELLAMTKELAILHGHEPELLWEHLPRELRARSSELPPASNARPSQQPLSAEAFHAQLLRNGGNVLQACQMFGISRSRAYRLIANHGIDLEKLRGNGAD